MVCGIYKITCLPTGKCYVGLSKNIKSRWRGHRWTLNHNQQCNPYFQNAWNKYGEENFEFTILEECPEWLLGALEAAWFGILSPEFNANLPGSTTNHSEVTRKKISETRKATWVSPENWVETCRQAQLNRVDMPVGTYTVYDEGNQEFTFENLEGFCRDNGYGVRAFRKLFSGERESYRGLTLNPKPVLISPSGEEFIWIKRKTARELGFVDKQGRSKSGAAHIYRVMSGQEEQYKGWRLKGGTPVSPSNPAEPHRQAS